MTRVNAAFGQGTGPILLADVVCSGVEYELLNCQNVGLFVTNCAHSQDAGVVCMEGEQVFFGGALSHSVMLDNARLYQWRCSIGWRSKLC